MPAATWTDPVLIATDDFVSVDLAIDDAGAIHIAASPPFDADADHAGIWYLTNATGSWTQQRVTTPPLTGTAQYDGTPSIAVDQDGSVGIAFTRWSCADCASDGIYYVTNANGSWSDAVELAGHGCMSPSLVLSRHVFEMAYQQGNGDGPVWIGSNAIGSWASIKIADRGSFPSLALNGLGLAGVLFQSGGVRFIQQQPNDTMNTTEPVTGNIQAFDLQLAYDQATDRMWAAWSATGDGGHSDTGVASRSVAGWSQPRMAIPDSDSSHLGVIDGIAQLIARQATTGQSGALLYSTNANGAFAVEPINPTGGDAASLAIDAAGRANVVFASHDSSAGLWYVIGPNAVAP